jgi:hypothetical protein
VIRRIVTLVEEISAEPGAGPNEPVRRAAAAAVIQNPWAGRGRVDDLTAEVERIAPAIAVALTDRLAEALGGADEIEAFGKAAIVGTDGEIEHGAALIHTPWFGDVVRQALDGTSIIVFSDTRGSAGTALVVPVWHKTAAATRSHYQTVEIRIADAPRPGEIVLVCAAATGGRPQARIGDRTTDTATVRLEDHRP